MVFLTAVNRRHDDAGLLAVAMEGFGNLKAKFARRNENEDLGKTSVFAEDVAFKERQSKGGRLTSAGSGLPENVGALQQSWNSGLLNRRRLFKAELCEGLNQVFGETEFGKRAGGHEHESNQSHSLGNWRRGADRANGLFITGKARVGPKSGAGLRNELRETALTCFRLRPQERQRLPRQVQHLLPRRLPEFHRPQER